MRDLCGAHRREINILVGALRERVPLDLLAARNSQPRGLLLTRLARRLEEHLAQTEEAARWAVDSWALALGIVSEAELDEEERRRTEVATPRVEAPPKEAAPSRTQHSTPRTPAQTRQAPPPATTQTPPASRPTGASRPSAPAATRPSAQGIPTGAARRPSPTASIVPASPAPVSPRAANTGGLQNPLPADRPVRRERSRWRGCLVGCMLLILLSVLLFVGGPLVLNILREEQQQRSLEPPPVLTR